MNTHSHSQPKIVAKSIRKAIISIVGRLVRLLTGDPVLANFIEVVGTKVPASALTTLILWRIAMSLGNFMARYASFRRFAYRHITLFHRLNQRVDQVAQAIAMTPLDNSEERLRWCHILGIAPDHDLEQPFDSYRTLNDLFTHGPGKDTRPIVEPENNNLVTAPCDGSYALFMNTLELKSFISKQSHFEVGSVLGAGAAHLQHAFYGGAALFIWLSAKDNHRWYAPVSGKIVHAKRIDATTFGRLGLFLEDGYCEANTRGVIIIEREGGGLIALVSIGLTPINTINVMVAENQTIKKGELLGCFEVGGSAALVFFDHSLKPNFDRDFCRFSCAEEMLNLNYVSEQNKARRLIGQQLAALS